MSNDLFDSKINKHNEQKKNKMVTSEGLEKIGAGNQFICWISNYNIKELKNDNKDLKENESNEMNKELNYNRQEEENEIYFQGNSFSQLFLENDIDFSINKSCYFKNDIFSLVKLNLHDYSIKNDNELYLLKENKEPFFKNYIPIQISTFKNSVAILLKSKDEEINFQFLEFKNYFNEIITNLKGKKETFQSYFLSNLPNRFLKIIEPSSNKKLDKYFSYEISISDFTEKLTDLMGHKEKNQDNLIKNLKDASIINDNKINLLKFYKILYSLDTINETKLIILGDFVRQYYKHLTSVEDKKKFKDLYNNTLCFELPEVLLPLQQISIGINHLLLLTIEGEVYTIGDGSKGATGIRNRKYTTIPCKVEFPFKNITILKIAAGARHSLSLDTNNTIYSWGCGACGCLGLNSTNDSFEPKEIIFNATIAKVRQLEASENYSACLCEDGNLYTWGNPQFGRLGHGEGINTKIPQQVGDSSKKNKTDKFNKNIKLIKAGYFTMLVVTMNNEIFGFGLQTLIPVFGDNDVKNRDIVNYKRNSDDDFYVEKTNGKIYSFKILYKGLNKKNDKNKKNKDIIGLFVGNLFYGFVTKEREKEVRFYKGGEYEIQNEINIHLKNLLGLLKMQSDNLNNSYHSINSKEENEIKEILNGYILNGYTFQNNNQNKKEKKIKKIVCSENNSAILSNTGDLYVFGSYIYQVAPQLLENCFRSIQPRGKKIISVALGANHIIMITSGKEVYSAGRNSEGQLGLGFTSKNVDISNPKQIEGLNYSNARKCYASENYSVVITMGSSTKVWVFGDIPFLQNSSHINYQLELKEMNWGEIERMACASNHILLLKKDEHNLYTIMSVGNGMYGKLGDGDLKGKNHYEPINVDLPNIKEIKNDKDVKLSCGKYTSAVLVKANLVKGEEEDNNSYKLYMWGLCHHDFFVNVKDVQSNHTFEEPFPIESTIPVIKPTIINTISAENMAIGEGINYFISSGYLKSYGKFIGIKGKKIKIDSAIIKFEKVAVGLNHAMAISNENKLYAWGSDVMNKLGFEINLKYEDKINNGNNNFEFDNEKFFEEQPRSVDKLNELFQNENEENKIQNEKKNIDIILNEIENNNSSTIVNLYKSILPNNNLNKENETHINIPTTDDNHNENIEVEKNNYSDSLKSEEDEISEQEEEEFEDDTIYATARKIVKNKDYEILISELKVSEYNLSIELRRILEKYKNLVDKKNDAKLKKNAIKNMFYFKFSENPFNVEFKNSDKNYKKFPSQFIRYRKNYKALLSALHTHPCYLLRIYEYNLMNDKKLYKVIKQIFKSMRNDEYTQLLFITLCKGILEIDLKKLKITSIDKYQIFLKKNDNSNLELTLFGKVCRFLFKNDSEFIKRHQIAVMCIVSNIYSSTTSHADCGEDLLLLRNPNDKNNDEKIELTNYERNNRIGKIMKQFNIFSKDILEGKLIDGNNVFLLDHLGDYKPLFKLTEMTKLLIKEIISVFERITQETDKIYEWISKKFGCIVFNPMIKILENPLKKLALNANLTAEKSLYNKFMEVSKDNFYSVAYTFKYILTYIAIVTDETRLPDNEINKQIEKEYNNDSKKGSSIIHNLQKLIKYGKIEPDENKEDKKEDKKDEINNEPYRFELKFLKEFFRHSLNDSNYVINFSLSLLKDLYLLIVNNKDKIKLINQKSDVIEEILQHDGCLESGGLENCPVAEEDKMIQFKLKTKSLCLKPVLNVMRCRNCKCILLNDYILGNETSFFTKFEFINENSAKGKYIQLLRKLKKIDVKNDKINIFLKLQYESKTPDYQFNELLKQLFILMAVDLKEDLSITEDIINDEKKLFQTMFTQNTSNIAMKRYSKEIVESKKNMEFQKNYYGKLFITLEKIEKEFDDKIKFTENKKKFNDNYNDDEDEKEKSNLGFFLNDIYEKVETGIMRGYGNSEIKDIKNTLLLNCKLVKVLNYNDSLPRSEAIVEKLPQSMKKKIQPARDFSVSKLLKNDTIIEFVNYQEVYSNPDNYVLNILKNEKFEFILTLLQFSSGKSSSFTCGSNNKSSNDAKKLKQIKIDNKTLSTIIKYANKENKNDKKLIQKFNIQSFIVVDAKKFIKILKKIFNIGFY